ncbi:MAG TPA: exonuclease domain-containing protein [Solirubrobacterales bacterium]|nr:exonuclease domain-containing protein [Solirubrobacterales bacterium]
MVDCETTGFHPGAHHRIIELAIVDVDVAGRPVDKWASLLRVDRDLGPTGIHGIRGRDLRDAPSFEEVLGEVLERLAGKTIVAHNVRFDCSFLESEFDRVGIDVKPLPRLCTMALAGSLNIGGNRMRLTDCAMALGTALDKAHSAEADAMACAAILTAFLREKSTAALEEFRYGEVRQLASWPKSDRRAPCCPRGTTIAQFEEPSFLATLVGAADSALGPDTALVAPYLEVLDRAIEDRRLSETEQGELAETAVMLGLSADRVRSLHSDYMGTLIALARRDSVVTERERHDLVLVGEALGINEVEDLLDQPFKGHQAQPQDSLLGKTVCFTGALTCIYEGVQVTRELAHQLAEEAGMTVAPRVTKKLDMLVVADPDSMSGKAAKAREYGIRVVAEAAFWPMLGIEVS